MLTKNNQTMTIRHFCFVWIFCALTCNCVKAQNWQGIAPLSSCVFAVDCFYEDTTDNRLYIGGYSSNGFCYYDGNAVIPMGGNLWPVKQIIKYHDTIYVSAFASGWYLCKWNGNNWDTNGISANGMVWSLHVYNDELYAGGIFTSIGGINANGIAKYNGYVWSDVGNISFGYNYGVFAIADYSGEVYIGGSFGSAPGVPVNILRWNGAQWDSVGGGMPSGAVGDFEVYGNELYIGGAFRADNGAPGNYIAKWNGSTYSDVGGGLTGFNNGNGQVLDLMVYDNHVYAVGAFYYAGGVSARFIAKWDGTNWCGIEYYLVGTIALGTYNDELYVGCGTVSIIGSDTLACVVKWIGGSYVDTCGNTTGITENLTSNLDFSFYPNPVNSTGTFEAQGTNENFTLIIFDQLGREVLRKVSDGIKLDFSTEGISPGFYCYCIVQNGEVQKNGKMIIE
jgi:hypothetical protein